MRVTNEELAQWLKDTPTGLESGKLNFDRIRTYDIGLDLRDARKRIEQLEAALRAAERQLARFMDAQSENGLRLRIAELLGEPVTT